MTYLIIQYNKIKIITGGSDSVFYHTFYAYRVAI